MCAVAAFDLGPLAGISCERHLNDNGFSIAGSIHATHHLYPNFVKHAERITESANGGTLQAGILQGNIQVMRRQHHLLFYKAVKPGFDVVNEVSGPTGGAPEGSSHTLPRANERTPSAKR